MAQGQAALSSGDSSARALLARACELGETDGCLELGRAYEAGKGGPVDAAKARDAFGKTCAGPLVYSVDGCASFVHTSRVVDAGVDLTTLKEAARVGCTTLRENERNREARADACVVLGEVLRGSDRMGSVMAFRDACTLGSRAGCDAAKIAAAETSEHRRVGDVEGANLSIESLDADGVALRDISCKTEGGGADGLFGALTLAAGFRARKAQLDACSPKRMVETRVQWTATGGRMTKIHASGGSPSVGACVERALASAPAALSGACAATVQHGHK